MFDTIIFYVIFFFWKATKKLIFTFFRTFKKIKIQEKHEKENTEVIAHIHKSFNNTQYTHFRKQNLFLHKMAIMAHREV